MSTINQWPYFNDVEFRALTYQPHTANDNVRGPRTHKHRRNNLSQQRRTCRHKLNASDDQIRTDLTYGRKIKGLLA